MRRPLLANAWRGHKINQNVEFGCEVGEGGREYIFDKNLIEVAVARRVPGIYVVLSLARPATNVFGGLEKNGALCWPGMI